MKLFYGLIIAFSMYSRIPMPRVSWTEERMDYVMCFFPLVGAVLAALLWTLGTVFFFTQPGEVLRAAAGTVLPILVTGGIHMDGFMDAADAKASCQTPERKREIMKDPHTGAFAVIWACVYFLLYAAAFSALPYEYYLPFGGVFVAARALSGLSVVMFPKAGGSGLAAMFSRNAKRLAVEISMAFYLMITAVFWVFVCPAGSWCCIPVLLLVYGYYYVTATREFGGVTGDLAGYFLQLAELSCLAALALAAYLR